MLGIRPLCDQPLKVKLKSQLPTESAMMISQNMAEMIKSLVALEIEGIDRLNLNGYVP